MKKIKILAYGLIAFFCFFSLHTTSIRGEGLSTHILYVGGDGPGNYSSIQVAVNHASSGDTIFVYNGTYLENLIIDKSIILTGEQKQSTIIYGNGETFVVTLSEDHITLSGFTITNSKLKFSFAGIYVHSDFNTITDTILTGNYYGMQLGYATCYNRISNNTIFHNKQCGIYFNHASDNILIGNIVSDHPVNGFGLYEFSNTNRIINNTFFQNRYSGVNIRESYQNQVIGNTFIQNEVGLHMPSPEYQTTIDANTFADDVLALEEERDAVVLSVVVFAILVFFTFLIMRKILK
ncbi:MAG: right-handed parallel beta-helix repeat-containing protein [Candidatus Thermoplasmatota archaeon]|nr:right-handed parallel beta-helix repeat-containing protein [Candidatus Thermoplasmatota archaeon]